MLERNMLDEAFSQLQQQFKAKTKRSFLRDIRGQIDDDDEIHLILTKQNKPEFLAVTFDRRRNDNHFSYSHFDLVLVALDAICGGTGIYKPSNQMRAILWSSTPANLLLVLRYFARNNRQVDFRRALILPFPTPPTGFRIDTKIYQK